MRLHPHSMLPVKVPQRGAGWVGSSREASGSAVRAAMKDSGRCQLLAPVQLRGRPYLPLQQAASGHNLLLGV